MIVAIPSKGRPDRVRSQKVIPSAKVFVPASEVGDYVSAGTRNVIAVPDEIRGITVTRNYILNFARDVLKDPRVVMIDDDVKAQGWIALGRHSARQVKLTEPEWLSEWAKLFDLADDLGCRVWGVATDGALRSVYPWKPFMERSYVTASCMGLRADRDLRFDPTYAVKEDYELCLRCLKEDGRILAARHVYWANAHWADRGGCTGYRTQEMEEETIHRLMRAYPGMIRRITRGGAKYSIELEFPTA